MMSNRDEQKMEQPSLTSLLEKVKIRWDKWTEMDRCQAIGQMNLLDL